MENNLILGTFNVPYCSEDESGSVFYVAPAILAPEIMKRITFGETENKVKKESKKRQARKKIEEVTHGIFFGENIKRVKKALIHG